MTIEAININHVKGNAAVHGAFIAANSPTTTGADMDKTKPRIRCYDNGGKTADRYTVIYMDRPEGLDFFEARGMNSEPFHGIGMSCSAAPGWHLGRRVHLKDLPPDCQKVVMQDLGGVEPIEDPWKGMKS